ncbi:MAG: YheU family protein [Pseudomonadales bacterium]|nr:YheU family protein [Pseudomonadales bacterium]
MRVPFQALSLDALQGLIEAFVLREGTDYGPQEHRFEDKCASVRAQLEAGTAVIEFDPDSEIALIVPAP